MKRVVVTGAAGFIGRHVLPVLREKGYDVHALSSQKRESNHITWHKVDFLSPLQVSEVLQEIKASHALHLAWCTTPGKYWTATENLDWVSASLHFARAFARNGGKHLVVAGTCAEYAWEDSVLHESSSEFNPGTLYGVCKRSLFKILEKFCSQEGLRLAWGYIFYLFGSGEKEERFIPQIIRGLLQNIEVKCSSGQQIRDFLHVSDVAAAFAAMVDSSAAGTFNIGSGRGIALREIVEKLEKKLEKAGLVKFGERQTPANEPLHLVANTERILTSVDWKPKIEIDQGLQEALDWWSKK
ncbi:MAG: NAD(P)-dependent oxidoreductase [Verrucomicrobia bacterium]|nr:NAD(P)-dependent oxidoreductase [Verrucomicrobiota bacterium]